MNILSPSILSADFANLGKDILETYNLTNEKTNPSHAQLDMNSQLILSYIESEKHTFQEIVEHTKLPASELNSLLLSLELDGFLVKLANNSYIMA